MGNLSKLDAVIYSSARMQICTLVIHSKIRGNLSKFRCANYVHCYLYK